MSSCGRGGQLLLSFRREEQLHPVDERLTGNDVCLNSMHKTPCRIF